MSGSREVTQEPQGKAAVDDFKPNSVAAWFSLSVFLTVSMWQFISAQNFIFIWVASTFVALIVELLEAVIKSRPQKVQFGVIEIAFSLLGPCALLAYVMWYSVDLLKLVKRSAARAIART